MKMNDIKSNVKKLIQEHVKTNAITREIDSPYAKFNSRGQLMCIVCGIPVKSKIIWQAHINKRSHKENLSQLKDKQSKIDQLQYQKSEKKNNKKRALSSDNNNTQSKTAKLGIPKGILKNSAKAESTSDEETEAEDSRLHENNESKVKIEEVKSELPHDFFDQNDQQSASVSQSPQQSSSKNKTVEPQKDALNAKDCLPEGFFDDPVADAKARNVEYRDKDADEWESFMKEVSAAEVESRQIIAEDKEEAAIETQLEQVNDQIKCLQRIVELDQVKQSQLSEKKLNATEEGSDLSSDEEFSPVIWRTKNSLI